MAKLFGAQRLVLQAVHDLPKNAAGVVTDGQIAQSTQIALNDVQDWLETLEGEELIQVARTTTGLSASLTAKGRLQLSLYQPVSTSQGEAGIHGAAVRVQPSQSKRPPTTAFEEPSPSITASAPPSVTLPLASSPGSSTLQSATGAVDGYQVVLLIHGIRTIADWGPMVRSKLEVSGQIEVIPIKYGFYDALRFWFPLGTRNKPIERVYTQIRVALQRYHRSHPDAKLSVVAHSFGTYIIGQSLKRGFDIQIHRLILCGSVLPQDFPWEQYQGRYNEDNTVNECGKADIWPVLARSLSWGYGDSGTNGFGGASVKDRFHAGGHGQYFDPKFVEKYWESLIRRGEYQGTEFEQTMPATPWWLSVLGILPLQWGLSALLIAALGYAVYAGGSVISHDQRDSVRQESSRAPKQPPKPLLPGDIDIASASFMKYEGDSRAPRLDLQLTNKGSRPAFITKIKVNVQRTWRLSELPEAPGVVVPPGHNYVIKLKPSDHPYQFVTDISEGLDRDDFGRFSLQFEEDPWAASNTIYLADVELVANSDETTYKTKDLLFLITEQGVVFPTPKRLREIIAAAKSLGQNVDMQAINEALAENKRIILEVEETNAVKNPSLLSLIESAKASPLPEH